MWISGSRRGSALLAVLWLSAALAAIAFSLSSTVRGETDRAGTSSDALKAYYLAAGAVEEASLRMYWRNEGLSAPSILNPGGITRIEYPSGVADVEMISESSKLDINGERVEGLFRLLTALGLDAGRAQETAMAIDDWRRPPAEGGSSQFDSYYLSQVPSFRARHASFLETEELLQVKGVTPELYYGTYVPNPDAREDEARLVPRGGLGGCVSVWGSRGAVDINTARPEVLAAIGLAPDLVYQIVQRRKASPFKPADLPALLQGAGPAGARLRLGGGSFYTVRATARVRLADGSLSDLKRTVAALIKLMPSGYDSPVHVLRWYDTAWSN